MAYSFAIGSTMVLRHAHSLSSARGGLRSGFSRQGDIVEKCVIQGMSSASRVLASATCKYTWVSCTLAPACHPEGLFLTLKANFDPGFGFSKT